MHREEEADKKRGGSVVSSRVLSRQRVVGHFVGGNDHLGCCADGALLFSAGSLLVAHDWKRDTHRVLLPTKKIVSCVAAHPTAAHIVASAESSGLHRITVWDLKKRASENVMRLHKKRVAAVAFSGDGSRLISCGGGEVYVWRWKTSAAATLHTLGSPFSCVAPMAPCNMGFLVFGTDSLLEAVPFEADKKKGMPKFRFRDIDGRTSVNFVAAAQHSDGHVTVAVTQEAHIADFKSDGKLVKWVRGLRSDDRKQGVHVTASSIGPRCICIGASNGKINVFDADTFGFQLCITERSGQLHASNPVAAVRVDTAVNVTIHAVYMDKTSTHVELTSPDRGTKLLKSSQTTRAIHGTAVWGMASAVSPQGALYLASCSEDGRILLWLLGGVGDKVKSAWLSQCLVEYRERNGAGSDGECQLRTLAVDKEICTLAVGDKAGNVYVFSVDVTASEPAWLTLLSVIEAHDAEVQQLSFIRPSDRSSNFLYLLSCARDGFIHFYHYSDDIETLDSGRPCHTLLHTFSHGSGRAITSVYLKEVAHDSYLLVSSSADGRITNEAFTIEGNTINVTSEPSIQGDSAVLDASPHPGGAFLLTVGKADMVTVRHLARSGAIGQAYRNYRVHSGKGHYLVRIDPTGRFAALASYDGTVTLIDYLTGTLLAQTPVSGAQPTSLAWVQSTSPQSESEARLQLIVGDAEGCLTVWKCSAAAAARLLEEGAGLANPAPAPQATTAAQRRRSTQDNIAAQLPPPPQDPRLFNSGVLRDAGVGGKWHTAAYQAFVTDQKQFPEMDTRSTMSSVWGSTSGGHPTLPERHHEDPMEAIDSFPEVCSGSDDEANRSGAGGGGGGGGGGVELTRRSLCATSDIEALLTGIRAPSPSVQPEQMKGDNVPPMRRSLTSKWMQDHKGSFADIVKNIDLAGENEGKRERTPSDPHPSISPYPDELVVEDLMGDEDILSPSESEKRAVEAGVAAEESAATAAAAKAAAEAAAKAAIDAEIAAEIAAQQAAETAKAAFEHHLLSLQEEETQLRPSITTQEIQIRDDFATLYISEARLAEKKEREAERRRLEAVRAELAHLQQEERESTGVQEHSERLEIHAAEAQFRAQLGMQYRESSATITAMLSPPPPQASAILPIGGVMETLPQEDMMGGGGGGGGDGVRDSPDTPLSPSDVKQILAQRRVEYLARGAGEERKGVGVEEEEEEEEGVREEEAAEVQPVRSSSPKIPPQEV